MTATGERSDADLLASASTDPSAFRDLYDRHAETVHSFALARVHAGDAALEVTAETFARAWFASGRFRDRRSGTALPWLFGIAANVIRESARRHRLATDATDRLGIVLGVDRKQISPEQSWVDGLDLDLDQALASLPDNQRVAVLGRVVDDTSYEELAHSLDCTPQTARSRVSRGLSHLRRLLQEEPDEQQRPSKPRRAR